MGYYDDMDTSGMDSGDWSGTDVSSAPEWSSGQLSSDFNWGGVGSDYTSDWGMPTNSMDTWSPSWTDNSASFSNTDNPMAYLNNPTPSSYINPAVDFAPGEWGAAQGGVESVLSKIFSDPKAIAKLTSAFVEGNQNKRYAGNLQSLINSNRSMLDPFGGQRPFYQQQLQDAVQNPYGSAIVRDQVNQIAEAQARKDAVAGRRSNSATSSPAMLAAQAQVAQNYMNSLMGPAGASIAPQGAATLQALLPGAKASAQGYASPLASAIGNIMQGNENTNLKNVTLEDVVGLLNKMRG